LNRARFLQFLFAELLYGQFEQRHGHFELFTRRSSC
jgi:hypothetical protein